jgi:hypothetical protein
MLGLCECNAWILLTVTKLLRQWHFVILLASTVIVNISFVAKAVIIATYYRVVMIV